jgi:D-glycero-D-manno-heptose 1,7-bisphosphate phosphatase
MKPRGYVVLDRDGTIIAEKVYLADAEQVELLPGAAAGLRRLRRAGLGLIVVTNQSGIGRGYLALDCLEQIHRRMQDLLRREEVELEAIYHCPHTPKDDCACRKPRPGLLQRASAEWGFDLATAFVVGDKPCDVDLGRGVGATTVLVRTGYGAQVEAAGVAQPDYIVDNLEAAGCLIELLFRDRAGAISP